MARRTKLCIVLTGEDAKEFIENEGTQKFTEDQISFFREARRIYREKLLLKSIERNKEAFDELAKM